MEPCTEDEIRDIERLADELIERINMFEPTPALAVETPRERLNLMRLHAVMNAVGVVFEYAPEGNERLSLCQEARADLEEVIKASLTPDGRSSKLKLVPLRR
jgi:hypothetical protein